MDGIRRELFPIVEKYQYFNTCSTGALATPVKIALNKFIENWDNLGGLNWMMDDGWTAIVEKARELFARIINADPSNIAFSFGHSVASVSVTSALDYSNKNELIFNEFDFPATPANIMAMSQNNLEYKVAKSQDGLTIQADDYRRQFTDKTALVTACEVISNTGFRLNSQELVETAHEKDIPVFLDTYQSMGYIPFDVKKTDVDFLSSGCLKWLLGGFGISFLYIRDDWIERLNPSAIGWMGVEEPFEDLFDRLRTTLHRPKDARKFQMGTPYPIGAASAYEGMKLVLDIGVDKIHNYTMDLTQHLIDNLLDRGIKVSTPVEKNNRGAIINIQVDNAAQIVEKLREDRFILDMRSHGIRVAPYFYNNKEDIDHLINALMSHIT